MLKAKYFTGAQNGEPVAQYIATLKKFITTCKFDYPIPGYKKSIELVSFCVHDLSAILQMPQFAKSYFGMTLQSL